MVSVVCHVYGECGVPCIWRVWCAMYMESVVCHVYGECGVRVNVIHHSGRHKAQTTSLRL